MKQVASPTTRGGKNCCKPTIAKNVAQECKKTKETCKTRKENDEIEQEEI
jgi:hypothetical protein